MTALDDRQFCGPAAPSGPLQIDDERFVIRRLRPEDAEALHAMGAACSPEDLRARFLHTVRNAEAAQLRKLTELDPARELALIAFADGDSTPAGVVRLHADKDGGRAEFAVLVRTDLQRKGLGRMLMELIIDCARQRGVRQIEGSVLAENERMLGLARSLGFSRAPARDGVAAVRLSLSRDRTAGRSAAPESAQAGTS